MLAVGVALTACEDPAIKMEQEMIEQVVVKAMTGSSVTTTAGVDCDPETFVSETFHFAVCYVVNIANLPEVDDVRYDDYEFYAMKDGQKYIGSEAVYDYVSEHSLGVIDHMLSNSISVADLALKVPQNELYQYTFYVEAQGVIRQLRLNEVYQGIGL